MKLKKKKTAKEPQRVSRLRFFFPAITLFAFVLLLRLIMLQGAGHQEFVSLSHRNRVNVLPIPAPRGVIYDRNHRLLAYDQPVFSLVYTRGFSQIKKSVAIHLASLLQKNPNDLWNLLSGVTDHRLQVTVASQISPSAVAYVSEHGREFPGLQIIPDSVRVYPMSDTACHIIGYTHSLSKSSIQNYVKMGFPENAKAGWSGVEKSYDSVLRGIPGKIAVEIDSQGVPIRRLPESRSAKKGKSIILSIDSQYQKEVQDVLSRQIQYLKSHGHKSVEHAMAVALNPQTGEILAMASYPSYHPDWMVKGMSEREYEKKFVPAEQNWVTQVPVAPGSVMKPLTALFAFQKRVLHTDSTFSCEGAYVVPETDGTSIHCWSQHGSLTLPLALAESCDVFFYKLSLEYGNWPPRKIKDIPYWLRYNRFFTLKEMERFQHEFGLGKNTEIDLPDEESGFVNDSSGQVTDLPYTAIGQNEVFTTLELANYAATLANRGVRVWPHVVTQAGGQPIPIRKFSGTAVHIAKGSWDAVTKGLYLTCNDWRGTAYQTFHSGRSIQYTPMGKTGTAETGIEGFDNAVFIGYAPSTNPQIAIAVAVPGGGHGADSTGPIVRAMFDRFFAHTAGKHNSRVE